MTSVEFEHVSAGQAGHVAGYDVFLSGDDVRIIEDRSPPTVDVARTIDGLGEFVQEAEDLRLGWAELPDFEVIYIYDLDDDRFGYGINLSSPRLSEWGYAPFTD